MRSTHTLKSRRRGSNPPGPSGPPRACIFYQGRKSQVASRRLFPAIRGSNKAASIYIRSRPQAASANFWGQTTRAPKSWRKAASPQAHAQDRTRPQGLTPPLPPTRARKALKSNSSPLVGGGGSDSPYPFPANTKNFLTYAWFFLQNNVNALLLITLKQTKGDC
jgi:hypothetical protein